LPSVQTKGKVISVIFTRQTTHLDVYVHPDELRKIADSLDEALKRQEAIIASKVLPNENQTFENTLHGDGVIITFRPPKRTNYAL
jgi:hypothetical protein